jgi:hypothetical protein
MHQRMKQGISERAAVAGKGTYRANYTPGS